MELNAERRASTRCDSRWRAPDHPEEKAGPETRILVDLTYFGHFLHIHAGGRSGKQHLLIRLLKQGGTLPQRALQDTVPVSSAALSETLTKLESEGLIERKRSEQDRRQLDVRLTERGREEAIRCQKQKEAFRKDAMSVFTDDELNELADLLDRLADHWEIIEMGEKAMQQ
ncbi:MAG: MarR family winged helix-turn-helix transcriptional regulator [Tractidigestivibacter sp.]|jgi:DNA-binding MarR family transcriptional regulator|uniref:MarR family winged helix-turn-helix transcriptional regulator n=1 Tax=Tractidigestivibacter sp. TaxID=2847320 RepID=UPI003D8A9002